MHFDGSRIEEMAREPGDERKRERLWQDTLRYTELKEGETILARWM